MAYMNESAAWAAPRDTAGWIAPAEVIEASSWVEPAESGGLFDSGPSPYQLTLDPEVAEELSQAPPAAPADSGQGWLSGIGAVLDPAADLIIHFSGGQEIEEKKADALLAQAQTALQLGQLQAALALRQQPKAIDPMMILLIGGGVLAAVLLMR